MDDDGKALFDELLSLRSRKPFEPFGVKLKTGELHEVREPSVLAMNQRCVILMSPRMDLSWDQIEGFEMLKSNARYAEIVGLLRQRPFVPFAVVRKNGDRYEVTERDRAGLSPYTIGIAALETGLTIFQMDEVVGVETCGSVN